MIIYGTIIGFLGGLLAPFESDLEKQTIDLTNLSKLGNVCFAGDLNIAFSGRAYPSKIVIKNVTELFGDLSLINLTGGNKNCALHAVVSRSFLQKTNEDISIIHFDKKITDHSLVTVTLTSKFN